MEPLLHLGQARNPQFNIQLIGLLIVMGFSVLSWVLKKLQEQAAKKRAQEEIERHELDLLRTGHDRAEVKAAPEGPTAAQNEASRRAADLRRRREELARRRAEEAAKRAPARVQTRPPKTGPVTGASSPPTSQPPLVIEVPGSGPIIVPRTRQAAPAPEARPAARARPGARVQAEPVKRPALVKPASAGTGTLVSRFAREDAAAAAAAGAGLDASSLTPADWRRAIIAHEVLSPPVSERLPGDVSPGFQ